MSTDRQFDNSTIGTDCAIGGAKKEDRKLTLSGCEGVENPNAPKNTLELKDFAVRSSNGPCQVFVSSEFEVRGALSARINFPLFDVRARKK